MEYGALVDVYERLAATQSNHDLVDIVAEALGDADDEHLPLFVTLLRGDPFAAWQPDDLGLSSELTHEAIAKATGVDPDAIEAQWRETGDLGSAAAWAVDRARQQTLVSRTLTVRGVHEQLRAIAGFAGEGSQAKRIDTLAGLLADAEPREATYLVRTVLGHLRLGVGEGTIRDAIAVAFLAERGEPGHGTAVDAVERGFQVTTDYRVVAETARDEGVAGLRDLDVELGRPLRVMLARKAEGLDEALSSVGEGSPALLEYKLDGFRVQIHKDGTDVTVFTRRLADVTRQFPDVVERVRERVDADRCILEGEVVAVDTETGEPLPFQELSRRIKRKYDIQALVAEVPVTVHLFDLLFLADEALFSAPLRERLDALAATLDPVAGEIQRAPHLVTDDASRAEAFYREALSAGQEGVMVKNREATYQPGSRVGYMVKVKPTMEPLDLAVVGAEWSEGRRSNNLGRLFLACRDAESGRFHEVGRLSTGFTDEELAELTERLEPHVVAQDGRAVDIEPTEVLAVAFEEVQQSPEYGSGYALRFPRFEGFRDDLGLEDVDTLERVAERFAGQ